MASSIKIKKLKDLEKKITQACQSVIKSEISHSQLEIEFSYNNWLSVAKQLRDDFAMTQLIELCGVDYAMYKQSHWQTNEATSQGFSRGVFDFSDAEEEGIEELPEKRYCVVYHLLDMENNIRLRAKVFVPSSDYPCVASVVSVWQCANWYEREAFDLFGILFEGHPDLRRILTDYGFVGHPLRKNFPLQGQVEMIYDPKKKQVVYQPVSIENRINTPRVVR
jgi:NADH-quinone oxidoreductase subunit C